MIHGLINLLSLVISKIKDLKTTNRDRKKVTKQGSRYSSVDIWLLKLQIPILTQPNMLFI